MTLYEKILKIYPELKDYNFFLGEIIIQNDSDGRGDYIAKWNHPDYARPTQEQIDRVE